MCIPALLAPLAAIGGGGAAAAGAGAAAAAGGAAAAATGGLTIGGALSGIGTVLGIGGSLMQAKTASDTAKANAAEAERQSAVERQLAVVEDERTRSRMRSEIASQRAELASRGISLDSPTAVMLGRKAAEEMSFASQSVRSGSQARSAELGAEARGYRAQARSSMLKGVFSAAGTALSAAPDLWPGLADRRIMG